MKDYEWKCPGCGFVNHIDDAECQNEDCTNNEQDNEDDKDLTTAVE